MRHAGRHEALVFLTAALLALAAPRAAAAANVACEEFVPSECGGGAGDSFCAQGEDCVPIGQGCECRPLICCHCSDAPEPPNGAVGGAALQLPSCETPCTDRFVPGLFECVLPCFIADVTGATCNLEVVRDSGCADGECPVEGCCTFQFCSQSDGQGGCLDQGGFSDLCAETDEATCTGLSTITPPDTQANTLAFVAGGICEGLFGGCVTLTPTQTPTATPTATPTLTPSQTPTNTSVPQGGDCTTPSQCATTFCVDGVCCDTACDQPGEICNQIDDPGVCQVPSAPAPALSGSARWLAFAALAAIGILAMMRLRRST